MSDMINITKNLLQNLIIRMKIEMDEIHGKPPTSASRIKDVDFVYVIRKLLLLLSA